MQHYSYFFAQAYGSGPYGSSTYQGTATSTTSGGTTSGATGTGVLTNTGFDVLLAASVACALIFAALVIKFWRRPVRKPEAPPQD